MSEFNGSGFLGVKVTPKDCRLAFGHSGSREAGNLSICEVKGRSSMAGNCLVVVGSGTSFRTGDDQRE